MGYFNKDNTSSNSNAETDVPTLTPDQVTSLDNERSALEYKIHWLEKKIELYKKHGGQDSKYKLLKEELKRLYHDAHGLLNQAKEITEEAEQVTSQAKESLAVTEHVNESSRHLKEDLAQALADSKNNLEQQQGNASRLDELLDNVESVAKDVSTIQERAEKSIVRAYEAEDSFKSAAGKLDQALSKQSKMQDDCDTAVVQLIDLIKETDENKSNIDSLIDSNQQLNEQISKQLVKSEQLNQETINNNVENKQLISKAEAAISNAESLQSQVNGTLEGQEDIQKQVVEAVSSAQALQQTTDLLNEKLLNSIEESKNISSKALQISNESAEFNKQLQDTQDEIQTLILEGELQIEQLQTSQSEYREFQDECKRITRTAELASAKVTEALADSSNEKAQLSELKEQAYEISKTASDKLHNLTEQLNSATGVVDRLKDFESKSEILYAALNEIKTQGSELKQELIEARDKNAAAIEISTEQNDRTAKLNLETERGLSELEQRIADAERLNVDTRQLVTASRVTQENLDAFRKDAEKSLELTNVLNGQSSDLIDQLKGALEENKQLFTKNSTLGEKLETNIKISDEKLTDLNDSVAFSEQLNRQLQERLLDSNSKQEKIDHALLEAGAINSESVKINGKSIELAKTTAELNQRCYDQLESLEKKLTDLESTNTNIQQLYDENSAFNSQLQHLTTHTHSALDRAQQLNDETQGAHEFLQNARENAEKLIKDLSETQKNSSDIITNTLSINGESQKLNNESSNLHTQLRDAIDLSDTLNSQANRAIADIHSGHETTQQLNKESALTTDRASALTKELEQQLERAGKALEEIDALNEKTQLITQTYQLTQQENQRLVDETKALNHEGKELQDNSINLSSELKQLVDETNIQLEAVNAKALETDNLNVQAKQLVNEATGAITQSKETNDLYIGKIEKYQALHEKYQDALKAYKSQVEDYRHKLVESERIAEQSTNAIKEFQNTVKEFQQVNTQSLDAIEKSKSRIDELEKEKKVSEASDSPTPHRLNQLEKSNLDLQSQNEQLIKQIELQEKLLQNQNRKNWFRRSNNSTLSAITLVIGLGLYASFNLFDGQQNNALIQELSKLPPTSAGALQENTPIESALKETAQVEDSEADSKPKNITASTAKEDTSTIIKAAPVIKAEIETKKTAEPHSESEKKSIAAKKDASAAIKFAWPIKADKYDASKVHYEKNRYGISITADKNDKVLAASNGEVIYSDDVLRGYGHVIMIKHSDELITIYARNKANLVKVGDKVSKGQHIAEVGTLFNQAKKGVYFEVRHNGEAEDPFAYLNQLSDDKQENKSVNIIDSLAANNTKR